MRKKILIPLLTLALCLTVLSTVALAEGENDGGSAETTHTHCVCGANHTSIGDHTAADQKTFTEWTSTDSLPSEAGSYYLTQNVTLNSTWTVSADITLCLNGCSITTNGSSVAIQIESSGTLTVTDCGDTGMITRASGSTGRGVYNAGTFNLYGGTICGYSNGSGYGINYGSAVYSCGCFNMYGGTFSDCDGWYALTMDLGDTGTIYGGVINVEIFTTGTIAGGTFTLGEGQQVEISRYESSGSSRFNTNWGVVTGGIFECKVINEGTISDGTFSGEVENNYNIKDGTFNGEVTNDYDINGGTFNGTVTNQMDGIIYGGTFNGTVTNKGDGIIYGGTFYKAVTNKSGGTIADSAYKTVTFHTVSGTTTQKVLCGQKATNSDGSTWYASVDNVYSFDTPVTANIDLYSLQAICTHAAVDSDNKCAVCQTQMKVYATDSEGNGAYFPSFASALGTQSTAGSYFYNLTLLADSNEEINWNYTMSIDLNGHELQSFTAKGSSEADITITDGSSARTGSIGTLTITSGSVQLYGGSYGSITGASGYILAEGYAFQKTDDNSMVTRNDIASSLTNVKVVQCTSHSIGTDSKCGYCNSTVVAQIGDTKYATFNEAYEAAQNGDTITLLADVTHTRFDKNISLTIDLGGKKLSSSDDEDTNIYIEKGTYCLKNGTVDGCNLYVYTGAALNLGDDFTLSGQYSLLVLNSGAFLYVTGDNVQVAGLSVSGCQRAVYCTLGKGTFGRIKADATNPLSSLLKDGYAFKSTDGTWYDQYNNDNSAAVEISNVTVTAAPVQSVTLVTQDGETSYGYGETIWMSATYVSDGSGQYGYRYWIDGQPASTSYNSTANTTTTDGFGKSDLSVGTHTIKAEAKKDGYSKFSEELTLTVTKGTLTANVNDPSGQTGLTYTSIPQTLVADGFGFSDIYEGMKFMFRVDNGEWSDSPPTAKDAGTYTVYWYIDGGDNYNNVGSAEQPYAISVTIAPMTITPAVTVSNEVLTYDGTEKKPTVTVTADTATLNEGTDYTVSYQNNTNAGTASVTVTAKDGSNYTFNAVKTTFTIAKADLTVDDYPTNLSAYVGSKLADIKLPDGWTWVNGDQDLTEEGDKTFYANYAGTDNYNSATDVALSVTVLSKVQEQLAVEMAEWTYGDTANAPVYTTPEGATNLSVKYEGRNGTTYAESTTVPTDAGDYTVKVSYETATEIWSGTADFAIAKATPTGAPKYTAITTSGKKLADANLTTEGGTFSVDGTVKWVDADGNDLASTTEVKANTAYKWVFTPTDSTNYNTISGEITLWHKSTSSGGGSSSNTTSSTVTNPNGSTTTTTTDKKTGEVTKVTKDTNGVTGTTKTDKDGNVTDISAKIPASAVKDGETITLPVDEVKAADKSEDAQEITVTVPEGGATIEVSVENPTPDTVIVIVDEDGNETIIPSTKLTENGVTVTLSESATIKVIRNGKTFSDVKESDYFHDAVLWAFSRGITGGNSATTFGPHNFCTRAQLVTFLWRAAGCPVAEYEINFSDVGSSYYTEAVRWAASLGIVGGYGNGMFGSDDTITREQMAVILYRFAQHTDMDTTQGGMSVREYKDYETISDYAVAAVQWAVNAGIMQGDDGNLMPGQPCTRAQIVTMLYRLLGK